MVIHKNVFVKEILIAAFLIAFDAFLFSHNSPNSIILLHKHLKRYKYENIFPLKVCIVSIDSIEQCKCIISISMGLYGRSDTVAYV